ncbi:MAG TPA: hypothetical protein VF766_08105 [Pyrinomonadaceae bacterium]
MFLANRSRKPQRHYVRLATACAAFILIALGVWAVAQAQQGRQEVRQVKSSRNNVQRSRASDDAIESSWSTDGQRVEVRARNVELSDDGRAIRAIRDNGYLFISDKRDGGPRELRVGPGTNGNFSTSYSVRGQQREFNEEARTWLAQTLLEFVRNSGYAADQRVNWLLSQQGPSGVLDEVSVIPSDNIKRIYLQKLAEKGNLNAANLIQVIEKARQEVTSDFELTEFLLAIKGQVNMSSEVRAAFMKTVDRLQSDSDRRKVLSAVATSGG